MATQKELMPGDKIGNYILERKLGVGGWGEVWLARHADLAHKPRVAIKFVLHPRPSELERFKREVAILDQLRDCHHTINAEDYGQQDGIPYLVMEYASGGDMARRIGQQIPIDKIADYIWQAADGLDYSHRHNIIHRDLKPGNLLFTGDDTLKLADFGIAHDDDELNLTLTGSSLGTPEYMPPEQFLNAKEAGPAADTYSLGIIAFQLITGRLPYGSRREGRSTGEILIAHREAAVPPLKQFNPQVPPGLQAVIEKALAKNPAWRYRTAGEFAAAFRQAIRAQSAPPQPGTEAYSGGSPFMSGTGPQPVNYNRPPVANPPNPRIGNSTGQHPNPNLNFNAGSGVRPNPVSPGFQVENNVPPMVVVNPPPAMPPVNVMAPAKTVTKKSRLNVGCLAAFLVVAVIAAVVVALNWEPVFRSVNNFTGPLVGQKPERSLLGNGGEVNSLAFSPDSKMLAAAAGDGKINFFNMTSAIPIATISTTTGTAQAVAFSPDGKTLASAGSDGSLRLWDPANLNTPLAAFSLTAGGDAFDYAIALAYSKDGKMLGTLSPNGRVRIFDSSMWEIVSFVASEPSVQYTAMAFSPDNVTIALGNDFRDVVFYDIATKKYLAQVNSSRATFAVNGLAFSPDGKRLASATSDKLARIWTVPFNRQPGAATPLGTDSCSTPTLTTGIPACLGVATFSGHDNVVTTVAFSPDGKSLATGGSDKLVKLWDAASFNNSKTGSDLPGGKELQTFFGHTGSVTMVAFSPDGKYLASASKDKSVKIWKIK